MPAKSLCIGDWVDFYCLDGDSPVTGFIVDVSNSAKVCHVFVPAGAAGTREATPSFVEGNGTVGTAEVLTASSPRGNQTYVVRLRDATLSPTQLHLSDIPALTDLALDIQDEKWFNQLVNYTPKPPVNVDKRFLLLFIPLISLFVALV